MAVQKSSRSKELIDGIAALTPEERALLKAATNSPPPGGIIYEPLRSKAAALRLVYLTSGLLKADVYHLLRGQK